MGSSGGGGWTPPWFSVKSVPAKSASSAATAEENVTTPAVAQGLSEDTENAVSAQEEARKRLRGVRSTYNKFADANGATTGSSETLG